MKRKKMQAVVTTYSAWLMFLFQFQINPLDHETYISREGDISWMDAAEDWSFYSYLT